MASETELKLRLDAETLKKLRRHPLIATLKSQRPVTRRQKSVYFDSPDHRLQAENLVLRVRHIGHRRIQTLKTTGVFQGGSWVRGEWESDIGGDLPEWLPLTATGLPLFSGADDLTASLRPLFTTDIRRTTYLLSNEDWDVELALDDGAILAEDRSQPVCEAELELKRGHPSHLFDLALALQQGLPIQVMTATKAARGFALYRQNAPTPRKAEPLSMLPAQTVGEAFRTIARSCFRQLLQNQECLAQTRDPEAVHQMRVALRRLRSAMSLFREILAGPETLWLREEMAWALAPLGAARDLDILIEEIVSPLAPRLGSGPGYAALAGDLDDRRTAAYATVEETLAAPRFGTLTLRLGRWIEAGAWSRPETEEARLELGSPIADFARKALAKRDRRVSEGMRGLEALSPEARHQTRIQIKNLRYTVDFFRSLLKSKKSREDVGDLARLQDLMGFLNDITIAEARLHDLARRSNDPDRLWAAGMIAGWHVARSERLLDQVSVVWKRYDAKRHHWRITPLA
jgi:inorganic triphosphatase YgiF